MKIRMRVLSTVACAAALMATGCGNLTIRSWVKVITEESSGSLTLGTEFIPIHSLQGGFLGSITLSTTTLPAPVNGTIAVDDVRIAGDAAPHVLGAVCVWGNPAIASSGTVTLDILAGHGSATINLNIKSAAQLTDQVGVPPIVLSQLATFPLDGVGLTQLLDAAVSGSGDGLLATSSDFVGDTTVLGTPARFALSLKVSNDSQAPVFDVNLLTVCGNHFNEQGRDIFYGINSKASYLLSSPLDKPSVPTVIKLADLGVHAGDHLKLARVGTYNDRLELRDGTLTKLGAAFSSTNVVRPTDQRNRIPGAIDAGTNVTTGGYPFCIIWPFCISKPSDIAQDFAVTNSPTVTVPNGAQYLIVGTLPDSMTWNDNSGFGLGVALTVNP